MSSRDAAVLRHRVGHTTRPSSNFERDWATPRMKTRRSVDHGNSGFARRDNMLSDRSISQPASPNFLQRGHVSPTAHSFDTAAAGHGRKQSDSTELAELLAFQQELQLESMRKSPNTNTHKKWVSCSNLMENEGRVPYLWNNQLKVETLSSPLNISVDEFASPSTLLSKSHSPSNSTSEDTGKWDNILIAKDDLIRQKDEIIDRQKKSLVQIEQHMQQKLQEQQEDNDSKLFMALVSRTNGVNEEMVMKLHEYQHENQQLRAHLTQISSDKNQEVARLTQKLGEAEYQLQQMMSNVKEAASSKEQDFKALEQKLADKEKSLKDVSAELKQSKKDELACRRQTESLKRYLTRIPTVEEYNVTQDSLQKAREENKKLEESHHSKEKKLSQINKALTKKSEEVKKLAGENTSLKDEVKSLAASLEKYRTEGPVSEIEFEDLKMEHERLQSELERTKKLLATKHNKMKELHEQAQRNQQGLEERLAQEEDAGAALREVVSKKESTIKDLRKSIREVAAQSQDLLEENLNFKHTCDQLQEAYSKENVEAKEQLWREVSHCIAELKAVVQVFTERKDGKEPDMARLLGPTRDSLGGQEALCDGKLDNLNSINESAKKVRSLRNDIDSVRTFLLDQFAEDVGNNCPTQ